MGYWTTLHLFNDEVFYRKVIPELKGQKGNLKPDYLQFLKSSLLGGIEHFSERDLNALLENSIKNIIDIANSFDSTFKIHDQYHKIQDYNCKHLLLKELSGYYDFCNFFEYYIFKYCADFFPYIPLGKGGLLRNFNLSHKTLSYSIICELDDENQFFGCEDRMGISNWILNEDVKLLYLDRHNLHFEDNVRAVGFITLLEIAQKNKLGLIEGIDLRESVLELLPYNKLINSDNWATTNKTGLLFER